MKRYIMEIVFAVAVVYGVSRVWGHVDAGHLGTPSFVSQGPTVERLEKLSDLVTTRVYIADVLTGDNWYYKGAWLIKGDALIGVNLRDAQITKKDVATKTATIQLPQPRVLQWRVDHEKTHTWEVASDGLARWLPWGYTHADALRDESMRQAQEVVGKTAEAPENFAVARANAEGIIRNFYGEVGWEVTVTWGPAIAAR